MGSQSYGFSSNHVWIWELDLKEGWAPKNWCFQTVVLEKTLESLLDSKIKPINPKGNKPWIFIGRTDAEAEAPILWPPDARSWLIRKDPDAGKDWRQKKKGTTEDKMAGWHHQLNGRVSANSGMVKDRETWRAAVHGVASETQLSYDTTTSHNVYDTLLQLSDKANTLFTSHFYKDLRPSFKSWLIGKDSDAGRGWRQEEKGTTEDEMAIWHHWLNGHESQWTLGVGDGQGGLACCDSWGRKELYTTERLKWTELNFHT